MGGTCLLAAGVSPRLSRYARIAGPRASHHRAADFCQSGAVADRRIVSRPGDPVIPSA